MSEILENALIAELVWLAGRQHRRLPRAANTLAPPLGLRNKQFCSACRHYASYHLRMWLWQLIMRSIAPLRVSVCPSC